MRAKTLGQACRSAAAAAGPVRYFCLIGPACEGVLVNNVIDIVNPDRTYEGQKFGDELHFVCPWHGWEYDIKTGEFVGNRKQRLRKFEAPRTAIAPHGTLPHARRCCSAAKHRSTTTQDQPMQVYTSEELDVMAEAYLLALQQLPEETVPAELTLQLVQHIGAGVARGIRDEHALAMAALKKVNLPARRRAARRGKPQHSPDAHGKPARSVHSDAPPDRIATI